MFKLYLLKDLSQTGSLEISLVFGLTYSCYEKKCKNILKVYKPHSTQTNELYIY